ncbi:MAG: MG2 domain-containing protein, partial [bacterium]
MSTQLPIHSNSTRVLQSWPAILLFSWTVLLPVCTETRAESLAESRSDQFLNVVGVVPLEGEVLKDRIVIFFDNPVTLPEQQPGVTPPPFTVEPVLDGEYRVTSNAVAFTPKSVTPEQIYRLTLNPELRSKDGLPVNPAHREMFLAGDGFRTKRLWVLREAPEEVVFAILFTFPADLDALRDHVTVRSKTGKAVEYNLEEGNSDTAFRLIVRDLSDLPLDIAVTRGVPDKTGRFQTQGDFVQVYPSERFLLVHKVEWGDVSRELQQIHIHLSTSVDSQELDRHLTITDLPTGQVLPHTFLTPGTENLHKVKVVVPDPSEGQITVTVADGLSGERGATLREPYSTNLEYRVSPLVVNYTYWRDRGKEGMALYINLSEAVRESATFEDLTGHLQIVPELPNTRIEYDSGSRSEFLIYGEWKENQSYELILKEGLPFGEGWKLAKPVTRIVEVEEFSPWAGFEQEGQYYFPRRSGLSLPLYTRRASKADLILYRMFPSNMVVSLREFQNGTPYPGFNDSWCEQISRTCIPITGDDSALVTTPINLDSLFPENRRGVFCLQANATKRDRTTNATQIVVFTDIGLLAHWCNDELVVFAHDLYSLSPLEAAKVTVYSNKNQVLDDARTDRQGMAHLKKLNRNWGQPSVIVVEHGDDFTFLELAPRDEGSREIRPEMPYYDRDAYDAFLYADRDLYRPGETVHLRWIGRTHYGDALADIPLLITVIKPNGKQLLSKPTTLSAFGSGGLDLETQKVYPTGQYRAQLSVPGSNRTIGIYSFRLEEFVPNRMKADVELKEPRWLAGLEYGITVSAKHLFG